MDEQIQAVLDLYAAKEFDFKRFRSAVLMYFGEHPELNKKPLPVIHSVKSRLKDPDHLADKIQRKRAKGEEVTTDNLFTAINDLIGVRVLHLYQEQFPEIHRAIISQVDMGEWVLVEPPKAYTWDPESKDFFEALNLETKLRETYYTSIHYVVKPNNQNPNPICCEIQVRTLFEEIWGEIDHSLNYPLETTSVACKEQLRVLAKLVSTGTRLADSIFKSHADHLNVLANQAEQNL